MFCSGFKLCLEIKIKVKVLKTKEDPIIYDHEATDIKFLCNTYLCNKMECLKIFKIELLINYL